MSYFLKDMYFFSNELSDVLENGFSVYLRSS